ncbi:MAG: putative metal-binding motif-containing protein [Myxococcota bacterium]|nr:putative metal-binding motif-containing protein [Myxococcota bacterium]
MSFLRCRSLTLILGLALISCGPGDGDDDDGANDDDSSVDDDDSSADDDDAIDDDDGADDDDSGPTDEDGDGFTAEVDCDDHDPSVHPGAPEVCDGVDSDCDGDLPRDEVDDDGDGSPGCLDCNDADAALHPGAADLCDGRPCGWNGCDGLCGSGACPDNPSSNQVMQVVSSWYIPGAEDTVFTINPEEQPNGGGPAVFQGQAFYGPVAVAPPPGTHTLHRLDNWGTQTGSNRDHLVSLTTTEGSPDYAYSGPLSQAWDSPQDGTEELHRFLRTSPFDHSAGFLNSLPADYNQEGPLGQVYPRFGLDDEALVDLVGSEVTLTANRVAGGAIWQLHWQGMDFLNHYDFGRQLQIAMQLNGAGEGDNPTEAGDRHCTPGDPEGWRHGSPVVDLTVQGSTLSSETIPMQWQPEGFYGPTPFDTRSVPVLWNGRIGKEVELDFAGLPGLIKWTTHVQFPQDQGQVNLELATAYLNGNFSSFYTYDASSSALVDKSALIPEGGCVDPTGDPDQQHEAGGVILATPAGDYAMGVYRNRPLNAVEGYGLCRFLSTGGTGPADFATTKWNLLERPTGGLSAGRYSWELYVLVGSLADVQALMDTLYTQGY